MTDGEPPQPPTRGTSLGTPAPAPVAPLYKGEPLDSERGPGLGCFWIQITILGALLILTPLSVAWSWDSRISAALLIVTLVLLLFAGQTVIFLLRLVAADRRTRRHPQATTARKTVGMLEDEAQAVDTTTPSETGGATTPGGPGDPVDPADATDMAPRD